MDGHRRMNAILIQAFDQDLRLVDQVLVSSELTPDDVVAYLDARLGSDHWHFYSAPELVTAE